MTPATFEIPKSSSDARIVCEKEGEPKGEAAAESSFKSNTVGNVLIGGIIGIGVDAMTGGGRMLGAYQLALRSYSI